MVMSAELRTRAARIVSLSRDVRRQLAPRPRAARFLADFPDLEVSRTTHPRPLPVCGWLAELEPRAAPETRTLVQEFVAAADILDWRQTYTAEDFGPEFLRRYGWTELIGLRGPIPSEKVACGFLMLGPEIEYPAHSHEAEELYLPLAGEALWMRGDEDFTPRIPGAEIEHPAWLPHATRTLGQPMLALYAWRGGDLAAKSRISRKAGEIGPRSRAKQRTSSASQ